MAAILKVNRQGRVTIPMQMRAKLGLRSGGAVEAHLRNGRLVLKPECAKYAADELKPADRKSVENLLMEGIADIEQGRVSPPYPSARAMLKAMKAKLKKK
jgi:AbrB family looped-hinge helix DNA binding protein